MGALLVDNAIMDSSKNPAINNIHTAIPISIRLGFIKDLGVYSFYKGINYVKTP